MIRINYSKLGNSYLVSKKNFSTRTHKDLVYVAINLNSFCCSIINSSIPRDLDSVVSFEPSEYAFGTSLNDAKKKAKNLLINCGVTFDVEVRNKRDA
jgi:hypothetical protein